MVFDEKGKTFVTHEDVIFNEDVLFNGPVKINEINGENIEKLFQNTVFTTGDTEFSGDVVILNFYLIPIYVHTNYFKNKIRLGTRVLFICWKGNSYFFFG